MHVLLLLLSALTSTLPSNRRQIDVFSVLYTYNIRSKAWWAAWVVDVLSDNKETFLEFFVGGHFSSRKGSLKGLATRQNGKITLRGKRPFWGKRGSIFRQTSRFWRKRTLSEANESYDFHHFSILSFIHCISSFLHTIFSFKNEKNRKCQKKPTSLCLRLSLLKIFSTLNRKLIILRYLITFGRLLMLAIISARPLLITRPSLKTCNQFNSELWLFFVENGKSHF